MGMPARPNMRRPRPMGEGMFDPRWSSETWLVEFLRLAVLENMDGEIFPEI